MNYIKLINNFWKCDTEVAFNPSDTRLYMYLLHTCNSLSWKQPFGHSDRYLSARLRMSVPTVREAKNRLKQRGLIDFKAPLKASKGFDGQTKFWFPTVQENCTDALTEGYTVPLTDDETEAYSNNKPNKTKLKNKSNSSELPCQASRPDTDKINYPHLVDFFNVETKGVFGLVRYPISENRKKMIRARIREYGKEVFAQAVKQAYASDYLKGNNRYNFKMSFDWMIKPSNFEKIISGNYENRENRSDNQTTTNDFTRKVAEGLARADFEKQQRRF